MQRIQKRPISYVRDHESQGKSLGKLQIGLVFFGSLRAVTNAETLETRKYKSVNVAKILTGSIKVATVSTFRSLRPLREVTSCHKHCGAWVGGIFNFLRQEYRSIVQ